VISGDNTAAPNLSGVDIIDRLVIKIATDENTSAAGYILKFT
jgi:hypothetical protein